MITYEAKCPHCPKVIESYDSYGDARADRDLHMLREHPDLPDTTFDPRFRSEGGRA